MSQRPRSHTLETESRLAFEQALPDGWVYRQLTPDYGLDGQVEIFSDGKSTGRYFFVQLKGTDCQSVKRALSVGITLENCRTYFSFKTPILIVRYHAPSKSLFGRWWHTYDPYYSRGGKKTRTFRFQENDLLSNDLFGRIEADLAAFEQLRSPALPLPVPLRLVALSGPIQGQDVAVLRANLRSALRETAADIVTISDTDSAARYPEIRLSTDSIVVDFAGLVSMTLHLRNEYPAGHEMSLLVADTVLMLGLCLGQLNHMRPAAHIVHRTAAKSSLLHDTDVALRVGMCLVGGGDAKMALEVVTQIHAAGHRPSATGIIQVLLQYRVNKFSPDEVRALGDLLALQLTQVDATDTVGQAVAHYNLGCFHSAEGDKRHAFRAYVAASRLDGDYRERSYFVGELGTLAFDLGWYRLAEKSYRRALELGDTRVRTPWVADAIMMQGRYDEAAEELESYFNESDSSDARDLRPRLMRVTLTELLADGITAQQRKSRLALTLADVSGLEGEEATKRLEQAIQADAMCSLAWFNLGVSQAASGQHSEAAFSFSLAAQLQPWDREAWWDAAICAMRAQQAEVVVLVLKCAVQFLGMAFVDFFTTRLAEQPGGPPLDLISDTLEEIYREVRVEPVPFQLRLLGEGSHYEVVELGGT